MAAQVLLVRLGGYLDTNVQEVDCRATPSRPPPVERRLRSATLFTFAYTPRSSCGFPKGSAECRGDAEFPSRDHHTARLEPLLTFAVEILLTYLLLGCDYAYAA